VCLIRVLYSILESVKTRSLTILVDMFRLLEDVVRGPVHLDHKIRQRTTFVLDWYLLLPSPVTIPNVRYVPSEVTRIWAEAKANGPSKVNLAQGWGKKNHSYVWRILRGEAEGTVASPLAITASLVLAFNRENRKRGRFARNVV